MGNIGYHIRKNKGASKKSYLMPRGGASGSNAAKNQYSNL